MLDMLEGQIGGYFVIAVWNLPFSQENKQNWKEETNKHKSAYCHLCWLWLLINDPSCLQHQSSSPV